MKQGQGGIVAGLAIGLFLVMLVLSSSMYAQAQPLSPEGLSIVDSERKSTTTTGIGIPAQAGNVTQLVINASRISTHWQGYYGNITGEITLDDAQSNTLYAWSLANPTGEIFAVNTSATVNWANITCVNFSNATSNSIKINQTTLDDQYGIAATEVDGFNDTFSSTLQDTILIGDVTLDATDNCPQTFLYVNNQSQSSDYKEILLFDNQSALIFTTLIEPKGTTGFDGRAWDFEMLVTQNSSTVGTYYFYVELS